MDRLPLAKAVRAFRLGMEAEGNEALVVLIDALAADLSKALVAPDQGLPGLLEEILAAQARGDFLCVADLLEHELARFLG
jgi:hypothetical protein